MHKITRATLGVLLAATAAGSLTLRTSFAYKAYADKEKVSCGYCHNNAAGGGRRNYRGAYYSRNQKSFENFDDYAVAVSRNMPVGPNADAKPTSLTTPAPLTDLYNKKEATRKGYEAKMDDTALKSSYVLSLVDLTKAVMDDKKIMAKGRFTTVQQLSKDTLALDPINSAAKDSLKAAEDGLKAEEEKMKKDAPPAP